MCVMTLDPVIRTYMVGTNLWELLTHMESGAARVVIPTGGSKAAASSFPAK